MTVFVGIARGVDGVGKRQRERLGHVEVDLAAEHLRQRRRRGAGRDVRELAQGVELHVGVAGVTADSCVGLLVSSCVDEFD